MSYEICRDGIHTYELNPYTADRSSYYDLQCQCGASRISIQPPSPHEFGRIRVGFKDEDESVDREATKIWDLQEVPF